LWGAGAEDRAKIDEVLAFFGKREISFLRVYKDKTVDIMHESLIWKWHRLGEWVEQEAASAELYRDLAKDTQGKTTWGEPKLSSALDVCTRDAWNQHWARQYSATPFSGVEDFLWRSKQAVLRQRLWRRFGLGAAIALM
jgi:hypothetical protein